MIYGRWIPVNEAMPPGGPGLFQVRYDQGSEGVIAYPTGKSSMVYYGADDGSVAAALAAALAPIDSEQRHRLWVRFAAPEVGRHPSETIAESLSWFRDRFGALPVFNQL